MRVGVDENGHLAKLNFEGLAKIRGSIYSLCEKKLALSAFVSLLTDNDPETAFFDGHVYSLDGRLREGAPNAKMGQAWGLKP